jgi:hypothetical protein
MVQMVVLIKKVRSLHASAVVQRTVCTAPEGV